MKRFLVIAYKLTFEREEITLTKSFNDCSDACEYAIKKSLDGFYCQVRNNASGEILKGWW